MKKTKNIMIAMLMASLMILSACAEKATSSNVLKIGTDDTYPPFEYRNDANEMVGFEIDLAREIGKKLGMEVEFTSSNWTGIFNGLNSKNYDVIMSATSMTKERLETYIFSKPYMVNGQVIVSKTGGKIIQSPEELAGLKVGVQLETTADIAATKYQEEVDFEITKYDDVIQTFTSMKAGHVDVVVADYAVAIDYANKNPDDYTITDVMLTNEPIAVTIRKDDTDLKAKIDTALDALREDGTLKELSIKWLGDDYTSNIDETLKGAE
ncbi:MAG: ABC transporter substrate-binding protein [Clostridiaceae bacterium]